MISKDDIAIVDFDPSFAKDFAELNYEWIGKFFNIEKHDREILDHPVTAIIDTGGAILMAVDHEGNAIGTVALIPAGDSVLELTKMAVKPSERGKGIGDLLFRASLQKARSMAADRIFLESHRSLEAAITLYRKYGFVETPLDPDSLYDRADIRMELDLSSQNM